MPVSESWAYLLRVWSIPRFSWCSRDRAGCKIADMAETIFMEVPPPSYAVLWSAGVDSAGAPVAIPWGSRYIALVVVVEPTQKQPADCLGDVERVWLYHVNVCINSSNSNQSYSKEVFLSSLSLGLYLLSFAPLWKLTYWMFFWSPVIFQFQFNPIQIMYFDTLNSYRTARTFQEDKS